MKIKLTLSIISIVIAACVCTNTAPTPQHIETATPSWKLIATQIPTKPGESYPTAIPNPPTQRPTSSANAVAKIGDRVTQGDYVVTVLHAETATTYNDFPAESGKKYVAVEILIESNANSGVSVNPLYATLQDSDSYTYNVTLFGKDPSLQSENDLPSGEKMRGWVTFEVPSASHGFIFTYEPTSFIQTIRIRVDLGF